MPLALSRPAQLKVAAQRALQALQRRWLVQNFATSASLEGLNQRRVRRCARIVQPARIAEWARWAAAFVLVADFLLQRPQIAQYVLPDFTSTKPWHKIAPVTARSVSLRGWYARSRAKCFLAYLSKVAGIAFRGTALIFVNARNQRARAQAGGTLALTATLDTKGHFVRFASRGFTMTRLPVEAACLALEISFWQTLRI